MRSTALRYCGSFLLASVGGVLLGANQLNEHASYLIGATACIVSAGIMAVGSSKGGKP
jgi:drug/metabolite transporter (DMT)-like permease